MRNDRLPPVLSPVGPSQTRGPVAAALLVAVTVSGLLAGCTHTPRISNTTRTAIYQRAGIHFDQTLLVKPAESERPEFRLAPLLVQSLGSAAEAPDMPYTVYYWRTFARLGDRPLEQFNYVWFMSRGEAKAKIPQGVRITFDRTGKPVLWEPLRDRSGARILYVSQSLEAMAMTNFPMALPGRRFWVERSVEDAPDTVVARIIDDAATVMGPILYLEAGTHDVSTLLCRCMDAQAKEVVGLGEYGVASLDDAAVRWLVQSRTPGMARWLPGKPGDDLTQWLRLGAE